MGQHLAPPSFKRRLKWSNLMCAERSFGAKILFLLAFLIPFLKTWVLTLGCSFLTTWRSLKNRMDAGSHPSRMNHPLCGGGNLGTFHMIDLPSSPSSLISIHFLPWILAILDFYKFLKPLWLSLVPELWTCFYHFLELSHTILFSTVSFQLTVIHPSSFSINFISSGKPSLKYPLSHQGWLENPNFYPYGTLYFLLHESHCSHCYVLKCPILSWR